MEKQTIVDTQAPASTKLTTCHTPKTSSTKPLCESSANTCATVCGSTPRALRWRHTCPTSFLKTLCTRWKIASKKTSRDAQKLTAKTLRSVGGACRQEAIACWRTEGMSPAPECCGLMANSILWDPCGVQWGRSGHWPLLITYGTKRYRSEGMQQRRAATAELKAEQKKKQR